MNPQKEALQHVFDDDDYDCDDQNGTSKGGCGGDDGMDNDELTKKKREEKEKQGTSATTGESVVATMLSPTTSYDRQRSASLSSADTKPSKVPSISAEEIEQRTLTALQYSAPSDDDDNDDNDDSMSQYNDDDNNEMIIAKKKAAASAAGAASGAVLDNDMSESSMTSLHTVSTTNDKDSKQLLSHSSHSNTTTNASVPTSPGAVSVKPIRSCGRSSRSINSFNSSSRSNKSFNNSRSSWTQFLQDKSLTHMNYDNDDDGNDDNNGDAMRSHSSSNNVGGNNSKTTIDDSANTQSPTQSEEMTDLDTMIGDVETAQVGRPSSSTTATTGQVSSSGQGRNGSIILAAAAYASDDDDGNINNNNNNNVTTSNEFGGAIQAELVIDSEEEHRAHVRRQAQEDMEERLMATQITVADAQVVKDETVDTSTFRKRCLIIVGILVIVIGVVVGVVVATSGGNSNSTTATTPQPNSTCETAFGPLNTSGLVTYYGDTSPRSGNFSGGINPCQSIKYQNGYGQWYYLKGNNQKLRASTCPDDNLNLGSGPDDDNNDDTDTEILVYANSCSELTCVAAGDELCVGHGSVGWWATEGVEYFILVRGPRRSAIGNFSLTVRPLEGNGDCSVASPIVMPSDPDGNISQASGDDDVVSIFGSTRNETDVLNAVQSSLYPSCGSEGETSGPSAWYSIDGDDSVKCASVATEASKIEFPASLSIFEGGCNGLTCVANAYDSGTEVVWNANSDVSYHLSVAGAENTTGDFLLKIRTAPSNSMCATAELLTIGSSTTGTTQGSCLSFNHSCGEEAQISAGVFYTIIGTGNSIVASLCQEETNETGTTQSNDSGLLIFNGSGTCSTLECIQTTSEESMCESGGNQTRIQWTSEENILYYIFVEDTFSGLFNLTVTEV